MWGWFGPAALEKSAVLEKSLDRLQEQLRILERWKYRPIPDQTRIRVLDELAKSRKSEAAALKCLAELGVVRQRVPEMGPMELAKKLA